VLELNRRAAIRPPTAHELLIAARGRLALCRSPRRRTMEAAVSERGTVMRDNIPTFATRVDAGRKLGTVVAEHIDRTGRGDRPIVLALPRGGVPVGYEVARIINADLDVIVARKIGVPGQPELAIGAVAEDGPPIFNTTMVQRIGLGRRDLERMVERERAEVARRLRRYRGDRSPADLSNRTVIVVDDGLATGATARAALAAVRPRAPAYLIFAAPVCAGDSADGLRDLADEVLCVLIPDELYAVGLWYDDFTQTSDEEVEFRLAAARSAGARRQSALM
jgi:predicted phosphoribosyltransferase